MRDAGPTQGGLYSRLRITRCVAGGRHCPYGREWRLLCSSGVSRLIGRDRGPFRALVETCLAGSAIRGREQGADRTRQPVMRPRLRRLRGLSEYAARRSESVTGREDVPRGADLYQRAQLSLDRLHQTAPTPTLDSRQVRPSIAGVSIMPSLHAAKRGLRPSMVPSAPSTRTGLVSRVPRCWPRSARTARRNVSVQCGGARRTQDRSWRATR